VRPYGNRRRERLTGPIELGPGESWSWVWRSPLFDSARHGRKRRKPKLLVHSPFPRVRIPESSTAPLRVMEQELCLEFPPIQVTNK
jgi:hypothetical protein